MQMQLDIPREIVPLKSRIWISAADSACATPQALVASGALTYYFIELRGLSLQWTGVTWFSIRSTLPRHQRVYHALRNGCL
jgi:hypothetical protein